MHFVCVCCHYRNRAEMCHRPCHLRKSWLRLWVDIYCSSSSRLMKLTRVLHSCFTCSTGERFLWKVSSGWQINYVIIYLPPKQHSKGSYQQSCIFYMLLTSAISPEESSRFKAKMSINNRLFLIVNKYQRLEWFTCITVHSLTISKNLSVLSCGKMLCPHCWQFDGCIPCKRCKSGLCWWCIHLVSASEAVLATALLPFWRLSVAIWPCWPVGLTSSMAFMLVFCINSHKMPRSWAEGILQTDGQITASFNALYTVDGEHNKA